MSATPLETTIGVLHGPNLNMLGKREPEVYGRTTLADINDSLVERAGQLGLNLETFQSNHEGELIDKIQQAAHTWQGMIINPAAYTHTSIGIRDALAMLEIPIIEIHLSNIYRREGFRHHSLMAAVVTGQITGLCWQGYMVALDWLAGSLSGD